MAKQSEVYIQGLGELLRDFNRLPKDAAKELRTASKVIAEKHMVPAWKTAALTYAGPWGEDLANSVRAGSDRVPAAFGSGSNWIQYARTYKGDAIEEWGKAVDRAIGRWAL